jgi:hypothetical protein
VTVSTCGSSTASLWVTSHYLTLWYRFSTGQGSATVSFTAPESGAGFHYSFPADFGMWQVDNLSSPGGPGGGWAFSYAPCP